MIKNILRISFLIFSIQCSAQKDSIFFNDKRSDSLNNNFNIPAFSTSGANAESDLDQQDISSLLQSSRDVFTQFAGFQFGAAGYRMRGYTSKNQLIMINGVNVNNPETNTSSWSSWGGLNDVTRSIENRTGNVSSRYGFSGAGGYTNIDSKASSFKKGTRLSYASANRIFRNRFMLTHSTGMMRNGWALTLSASSRTGKEIYIPGTYFNASAFYISADKRINEKHLLSFTGFVAPTEQGRSSYEQLEAYDLANTNYYNALWGYQQGKTRNSSIKKTKRPMLMLSHTYSADKNTRLTTSLFYNYGKTSLSSLSWNDAFNPRPDYYRNLPGYYYDKGDLANGDLYTQKWANDVNTRQVNWDRLILLNRANLYTLPSQLGQGIITNETRARYIVEDLVENLKYVGINSVYNKRIRNLFLTLGVNAGSYKNRKYKQMEDLLGATYWLDYDQFAQNLGIDDDYKQNDIERPDRKIFKGDRFGYDYMISINRQEAWAQAEYSFKKADVYGGVSLSDSRIWREGFIANGKFPANSKGPSDKLNFFNYGIKAGITLKLNGRHFITANTTVLTRPPEVRNIFVSPNVRNDIVNGIGNENLMSADINYLVKYPDLKLRLTYYNTQINNQVVVRTYWHDSYNSNVNLIMKGVDQNQQGIELGIEKTVLTSHVIQCAFGIGRFIYTNRPVLEAWQDNNNMPLFHGRTAYLKNYRMGGSPQSVSGIGYTYNGKKNWFAGIFVNYFDHMYVEPNPDRRTEDAISKYVSNETLQYSAITKQQRLPGYSTININGGKSFRIRYRYNLKINLSVNNILNNKHHVTGGYEQLRWDQANINKFANKYIYMPGTTYMAIINFTF